MYLSVSVNTHIDENDLARAMEEYPHNAAEFFEALIELDPKTVASCFSDDLMNNLEEFVARMKATL